MENYSIEQELINFCYLTDREARYDQIKKTIYREKKIIDILKELVEEQEDLESRQNFVDHIKLFNIYHKEGKEALNSFFSIFEIHEMFTKFAYGFNNFEDRKKYLLCKPILLDNKTIGLITDFIESREYLSQNIASRLYRNLLKACRVIGIEKAFEEFETPEPKYVDVVNKLLKRHGIYEFLLSMGQYKEEISCKQIRNVFHYYQAKCEIDELNRDRLKAVWEMISNYQEDKSPIWFWE